MTLSARTAQVVLNLTEVNRRLLRWKHRVLGRTGAYGRVVMQRSMPKKRGRRAQKSIVPGRPPRSHIKGNGGMRFVLFDANAQRGSVMIGVARSPRRAIRHYKDRIVEVLSRKTPPRLLNERGAATYINTYKSGLVTTESVMYRKFPISDYEPTQVAVEKKFREFATIIPF